MRPMHEGPDRAGPGEDAPSAHPGPLELVDLVRGALEHSRERLVLAHCVACGACGSMMRALAVLRRARGLGVRFGLERVGGPGSIH